MAGFERVQRVIAAGFPARGGARACLYKNIITNYQFLLLKLEKIAIKLPLFVNALEECTVSAVPGSALYGSAVIRIGTVPFPERRL